MTPFQLQRAISLHNLGWTQTRIGLDLGVSQFFISTHLRAAGVPTRPRGQWPTERDRIRICKWCGNEYKRKLRFRPDRPGPTVMPSRLVYCSRQCNNRAQAANLNRINTYTVAMKECDRREGDNFPRKRWNRHE